MARSDVVIFLKEWNAYVSRITDIKAVGGTQQAVQLKTAINADILDTLVLFSELGEHCHSVELVTDSQLLRWIQSTVGCPEQPFSTHALKQKVNENLMFDLNEQNAKLRVMKFFRDFNAIIKENSWEKSVNVDPSEIFPMVLYQIQPATLRMSLQVDVLYKKQYPYPT